MSAVVIPPVWASNALYSAGPDTGSPTCIDPGLQANGFIAGMIAAAQHPNFLFNISTRADRRLLEIAALQQRQHTQDAVTISDTAESVGAVQRIAGSPLLAFKTAQALALSGCDRFAELGVPASITSLVTDAATNGTRIVVIGTGGNRCTYSDDDGSSWTAGGDIANTPGRIVWNAVHSNFSVTANSAVRYSANATSWTTASASADTLAGLAVLANGDVVCCANGTQVSVSTDGSANFTGLHTLPNAGSFAEIGSLAGNGGATIYNCTRFTGGASLQVSSSVNGSTWAAIATLTPPATMTFASRPRIMMCQNTGLLVVAVPLSNNLTGSHADALYASTNGTDWVGPSLVFPGPGINAYAVAGGRVMSTRNDMLFASDGIGAA